MKIWLLAALLLLPLSAACAADLTVNGGQESRSFGGEDAVLR